MTLSASADTDLMPWKSLLRKLRQGSHKGASVINPQTGTSTHLPSHRHTSSAHDLATCGVKMLAVAGWNEYLFDDLAT